ncbi:MAG TPA: YcxB family protein [Rhizomicrobium sp.]|nr:YcxB family protein [Rhizomicrobium sp.]
MADGLSLQVERSIDDYRAWRRQLTRETRARPSYRLLYWLLAAAAFVAALALMLAGREPGRQGLDPVHALILLLVFFGAWSLLNWIVSPFMEQRLHPPLKTFHTPILVAVGDDGVEIQGQHISQMVRWPAISDVVQTPTHVFLRVDGTSIAVIPKRAFQPASRSAEFMAAINDRLVPA